MDCLFCKIATGQIPSEKIYEDENMLIIKDINPQAKLHYLLLPKKHYADIAELAVKDGGLLAACLRTLAGLTDNLGLSGGYRLIANTGKNGCQSILHVHIHILGGEKLGEKMG